MSGPLDSPRVAPRRSILACLALLAGAALLLGCGSEGEEPSISEEDAAALDSRLDAIQEDVSQGDCTDSSNVFTRLTATREQIDASEGINEQAKSDLSELLDELEAQITEECDAAADASSTTSSSSSTEEDTTSSEEEPTSTEESTSTKETTTTETTTTEEPSTTTPEPTEPPGGGPPGGVPPGQGGEPPSSGGVGPSFESDRKVP